MRVPAVLIPYPAAMDNHQFENARAFAESGAACFLEEKSATSKRWQKIERNSGRRLDIEF